MSALPYERTRQPRCQILPHLLPMVSAALLLNLDHPPVGVAFDEGSSFRLEIPLEVPAHPPCRALKSHVHREHGH